MRRVPIASVAGALVLALCGLAAGCGQPSAPPAPSAPEAPPSGREAPPTEEPQAPAQAVAEPASPAPAQAKPAAEPRKTEPRPAAPATPSVAQRAQPTQPPAAALEPEPPAVAPPPPPIVKTLVPDTVLDVILLDGLSSEKSQVGDAFRARVARDVTVEGMVVVPVGSVVHGSVTEVVPQKKIGGTAKLALAFSRLELTTGESVAIEAVLSQQGKSQTKKDAATIGGAAAGGALLGKLIGKDSKDALIGAVVGAAAGSAIAAKNKGEPVEIPVGTEVTLRLNRQVDVTVRP